MSTRAGIKVVALAGSDVPRVEHHGPVKVDGFRQPAPTPRFSAP